MFSSISKLFCNTVLFFSLVVAFTAEAAVRENLHKIAGEIQDLIDSTKTSIVTVSARFSREVAIEKEGGLLSFFKTEHSKKSVSYVNIGTGIVFDNEGHIVTRSSVVYGAESCRIILFDGAEIEATFVGHDDQSGFAVLKVASDTLHPVKLGRSDDLRPGSLNVLLGNTLGVYPSFTLCWINAIRPDGLLQISASLNPGNNGSPVINHRGEVVGLVAGLVHPEATRYQFYEAHLDNTTLAVPIDVVTRVVGDIIEYGHMRRGWLGIVGYHDGWKPRIRTVKQNSPAMQAGLQEGDVIVRFSENEIHHISDLVRLVEHMTPGQVVSLEFMREGELMQTKLKIGEKQRAEYKPEARYTSPPDKKRELLEPLPLGSLNLVEKNLILEKRIEELEKQVAELRRIIDAY